MEEKVTHAINYCLKISRNANLRLMCKVKAILNIHGRLRVECRWENKKKYRANHSSCAIVLNKVKCIFFFGGEGNLKKEYVLCESMDRKYRYIG